MRMPGISLMIDHAGSSPSNHVNSGVPNSWILLNYCAVDASKLEHGHPPTLNRGQSVKKHSIRVFHVPTFRLLPQRTSLHEGGLLVQVGLSIGTNVSTCFCWQDWSWLSVPGFNRHGILGWLAVHGSSTACNVGPFSLLFRWFPAPCGLQTCTSK